MERFCISNIVLPPFVPWTICSFKFPSTGPSDTTGDTWLESCAIAFIMFLMMLAQSLIWMTIVEVMCCDTKAWFFKQSCSLNWTVILDVAFYLLLDKLKKLETEVSWQKHANKCVQWCMCLSCEMGALQDLKHITLHFTCTDPTWNVGLSSDRNLLFSNDGSFLFAPKLPPQ